ncbi:S-crystallin 4 [Trichoplax sp. H2]|uniref:Uncharacterized protein n=1 Tax=Trichoplax adhaerens TaxID=10228 RepID=B3RW74_TRIAD|nr:expressed hypothetical protein [Trichoplax adhaerens]EDV25618.1 expressed hypothetical protein [Trichoplax adhaerens]RDD36290.1 S-crystallin 4 [Trichoplax sp. H2]|eukprot:XP_002111651.1 expressed hypothetical protein [Trichoplax adhaerens]
MPSYKLTYFNSRGRGEIIRYLFALSDTPYEDLRLSSEEWAKQKAGSKAPFGQLPILEVDGKVLCQSNAIVAYLAKEFGFAGKTSNDVYKIYLVEGAVSDLITKLVAAHFEADEAIKADKQKELTEKFIPTWLVAVEKVFQEGGTSYFAGDSLTVGDLYFFFAAEYLKGAKEDVLQSFPGLNGLFDRIANNPKIKEWREKRPKTEF